MLVTGVGHYILHFMFLTHFFVVHVVIVLCIQQILIALGLFETSILSPVLKKT